MTARSTPTPEQLAQSRALFFEGIGHFEHGRLESARSCFERCQALTPERPSVLGNLGVTLFHLGRLEEAIPVLSRATTADAALGDAWACLGLAHHARQQWQAAAAALEKALALSPRQTALRLALAQAHLRLGAVGSALRAYDEAIRHDPQSAPAWSERGSLLRETGRLDEAARCFEQALAQGGDPELNRYYLAAVRAGDAPPAPPRRYVEQLFDDYAAEFQSHAVATLGYRAHQALLQPLVETGRRYVHALDLGCGTGLCGPLLAAHADAVDGVDVSAAMLEEARRLGVYRELVHADLAEFLAATASRPDLVVAADVFIYVGELGAVLRSARKVLAPGGCLAFTVERSAPGREVELLPSLRYAHSEAYVRRVADEAGFARVRVFAAPIRHDQAVPIVGLYAYLE